MALPLELQVVILRYADPDTIVALATDDHFRALLQEHLSHQLISILTISNAKEERLVHLTTILGIDINHIYHIRYPNYRARLAYVNNRDNNDTCRELYDLISVDDDCLRSKIIWGLERPLLILDLYFYTFYCGNIDRIKQCQDHFERYKKAHLSFVTIILERYPDSRNKALIYLVNQVRLTTPCALFYFLYNYHYRPTGLKLRELICKLEDHYYAWSRYSGEYTLIIRDLK